MVNETAPTTLIKTNLFEQMTTEAGKKQTDIAGKAQKLQQSNEEFLKTYRQGSEQVLAGGVRDVKTGQSQLEAALETGKEFTSFVGETVGFLTSTFGEIEQYLGGITTYLPEEQLLIDKADNLTKKANLPIIGKFYNKAKLETARVGLQQEAEKLRTKRILKSTLDQNVITLLDYYKSMKDVMYQAGINNQKAANEVQSTRDTTMTKLFENEKQYDAWQTERKKEEIKLGELELQLATLTGEARTAKDKERIEVRDALETAKTQEDFYFGIVKNAQNDLKYQEQVLSNFRDIIRGINNGIVDMQEKIDNRTVLFTNIETILKTGYQVRSFGQADVAMDKTVAEIVKVGAIHTEAILGELGARTTAKPMTPDELNTWLARSKASRELYEKVVGTAKADYAAADPTRA